MIKSMKYNLYNKTLFNRLTVVNFSLVVVVGFFFFIFNINPFTAQISYLLWFPPGSCNASQQHTPHSCVTWLPLFSPLRLLSSSQLSTLLFLSSLSSPSTPASRWCLLVHFCALCVMSSGKTHRYNRHSGGAAAAAIAAAIPSSPSTPPADSSSGVRDMSVKTREIWITCCEFLLQLIDCLNNLRVTVTPIGLFTIQFIFSLLQGRMEASFGPTFSAVAAGTKGDAQKNLPPYQIFTLSILHVLNFLLYRFLIALICFQLKGPTPISSTEELLPPPAL